MPQNIKINNVRSLDAKIRLDEYYDFMLYKGEAYGAGTGEECLAADFSKFNIGENGKIYSLSSWTGSTVDETDLDDIGLTGIDNGFIKFNKGLISNYDFLNILTGSTYHIDSGDTRFFMSPVTGNTQEYIYPMSAVTDDEGNVQYLSFNGGFYQGFYKLFGFDYQTLPSKPEYGWTFNFKIRPRCDYENLPGTINAKHPENDGMFFYMGTRAENKFWEYYPNSSAMMEEFRVQDADSEGYMATECSGVTGETYDMYSNHVAESDYLQDEFEYIDGYKPKTTSTRVPCAYDFKCGCESCQTYHDNYLVYTESTVFNGWGDDGYFAPTKSYSESVSEAKKGCGCSGVKYEHKDYDNYAQICKDCEEYFNKCAEGPKAFDNEYLMADAKIDLGGGGITDSVGHLFNRTGYYEILTDNKFLFFNRTCTGFTTCNWTDGAMVSFTGRTNHTNANYFLLMNRTCTGYTTCTIDKYNEANEKPYDIYKDLKNNAFGLRITKDGAIGYRYGILDCDASATNHYSVVEEYSKSGMVRCDEWNDITVRIAVLNPHYSQIQKSYRLNGLFSGITICENTGVTGTHRMKIYVYVNGYLKLVSKELPEFAFRELNDVYQKQEGVPFSLSLGGGTQGLMETIGPDYMNLTKYVLPLERDFGGSFNGDIKSFRMYDCPLDYSTIRYYLSKNNQDRNNNTNA